MADTALRPDSVRANPETNPADSIQDAPRQAPLVPAGPHTFAASASALPSRRGLLGAMGMAPVAMALASIPASGNRFDTVMADYLSLYHRLNTAPSGMADADLGRLENAYSRAYDLMLHEPPQNHAQMTEKFIALWGDGGRPIEENVEMALSDARRLAGEA
jgi:hypothetical protein